MEKKQLFTPDVFLFGKWENDSKNGDRKWAENEENGVEMAWKWGQSLLFSK